MDREEALRLEVLGLRVQGWSSGGTLGHSRQERDSGCRAES